MAFGPAPLGLVYFGAAKLAGYTLFARYLKRQMPGSTVSPWAIGGVRTAIGLGAGIGAAFLANRVGIVRSEVDWYVLLFPIRMLEWLALLALFFRPGWLWGRSFGLASLGTFWSYVLDIPALTALFYIPGGAWIC
jgi:hypothetical protein